MIHNTHCIGAVSIEFLVPQQGWIIDCLDKLLLSIAKLSKVCEEVEKDGPFQRRCIPRQIAQNGEQSGNRQSTEPKWKL